MNGTTTIRLCHQANYFASGLGVTDSLSFSNCEIKITESNATTTFVQINKYYDCHVYATIKDFNVVGCEGFFTVWQWHHQRLA